MTLSHALRNRVRSGRRLAVLLASASTLAISGIGTSPARAADIPLAYIAGPTGSSFRLTITVGINDAAPQTYLFDTGSTAFNAEVSATPSHGSPTLSGPYSTPSASFDFMYGDSGPSHGYYEAATTVGQIKFYDQSGQVVAMNTRVPVSSSPASGSPPSGYVVGLVQYPVNGNGTQVSQNGGNANGLSGTFGAAIDTSQVNGITFGGILGQSTQTGYAIAANCPPKDSSCSPHVILEVTNPLRAQFESSFAWAQNNGSVIAFPVSGTVGTDSYDLVLSYQLQGDKNTPGFNYSSITLLDTGTSQFNVYLTSTLPSGFDTISSLVITDPATGAILQTARPDNGAAFAVDVGASSSGHDRTILGIGFFMANSVLYDFENRRTGITSFFVTDAAVETAAQTTTSPAQDYVVTATSGNAGKVGLAGIISGPGAVVVETGGALKLSNVNTYTGSTTIDAGGWLALVGPGSIASSSGVIANGTFDISGVGVVPGCTSCQQASASINTLSGNGTVALGGRTLILTAASGTFSGTLQDQGYYTGAGGSLGVAGGTETLTGQNIYTGSTTIQSGAGLSLVGAGSIASSSGVIANGVFDISGTSTGASITTLSGSGAVALGSRTLTLSAGSGSFSGALTDGGASGGTGGSLLIAGGAQMLAGQNAYTGRTTIQSGAALALVGAGSIASSSGVIANGVLDISGTSNGANITTLSGSGTVALGGRTLTLTAASGTFSGTLMDGGAFNGSGGSLVIAGGAQTLAGQSSYTGGTTVAGGTLILTGAILGPVTIAPGAALQNTGLVASIGGSSITNNGTLVNGGTLASDLINNASATTTGTIVGAVANTGTLTTSGLLAGSLANTGSVINTGAISIAASGSFSNSATLSSQGQGTFANAGSAVNSGTLNSPVTNTGSFTNLGTLTGPVGNAGAFANPGTVNGAVVNTGTFNNNGTVTGAVLTSGHLSGNGRIGGNLTVASGGTVAPGNSIGTLTVGGNVTFQAGSTYAVEIGSAGVSDTLRADGTVTLNGSTLQLSLVPGTTPGFGTYAILSAASGITGQFGTLSTPLGTAAYPFLASTVAYGANGVSVATTRSSVPLASVAQTPGQTARAAAVDTLPLANALLDAIVPLNAATAPAAFTALSGEIYPSIETALQAQSVYLRDAVTDRLRQAADAAAAPATGPQTAQLLPGLAPTVWTQAFGSWGTSDGRNGGADMSRSIGGFFMGVDTPVGETGRLGFAGGYSQSQFNGPPSSSGQSDNYDLAVYGSTRAGAFGLRFGASYTWHELSVSRSVAFQGFSNGLSSTYDAGTTQVFAELGYGLVTPWAALEPFANVAYVNLHTGAFSESVGAAALTGGSDSQSNTFTTLGLRAAKDFAVNRGVLTASASLGWQYAFGATTPVTPVSFAAGSATYLESGTPIARNAARLGAGLDFAVTQRVSVGVHYSGQLASSSQDNAIDGRLSIKF